MLRNKEELVLVPYVLTCRQSDKATVLSAEATTSEDFTCMRVVVVNFIVILVRGGGSGALMNPRCLYLERHLCKLDRKEWANDR